MSRKVLHLIGHAHLDPVWLWRWPEGYDAARATFNSVLDRMDEDPEFIFTCSQAAVYAWIERGDPELFHRIKARVVEGRWRLMGGWWVQPDCNIPGGEALVRQGLYGQRYFQEKFGVLASVGFNPDSFGHNPMLPQILKKSGIDAYVFMRPAPHENPSLPGRLFWWESMDGSRVLAYQIPYLYASWGEQLEKKLRLTAGEIDKYPALMEYYGVGNHGGGPTKENLEKIHELRQDTSLPELRFSAPDLFFSAIWEETEGLPLWNTELQHHARGCYAAHARIKRDNRRLEYLLQMAEKLALIASIYTPYVYPQAELTQAWQAVLFNQFHDILAGTSIEEACEDTRDLYGLAYQYATEAITYATGALADLIDTEGPGTPVVVFNPSSWRRTDYCEVGLFGFGDQARVEDDQGNPVPCQVIRPKAAVNSQLRTRICFPVEVDSIGYRLYWVYPEDDVCVNPLMVTEDSLENEYLRVRLDPQTGQIASLYDKKQQREVLASSTVAKVLDDDSDTWSHGVDSYDHVAGFFAGSDFQIVEKGPVRAAIRAVSTFGDSVLSTEYRLYAGSKFIECKVQLDWQEKHRLLKMAIPVAVSVPTVTYEAPYGHIQRSAAGQEEPGLAWVDVSDEAGGLCIVNDSKYSYDAKENVLSITVLRSPLYANHEPFVPGPEEGFTYMDQGRSDFTYRLVPHRGGWRDTLPHRLGEELNLPLWPMVTFAHSGSKQRHFSYLSTDCSNVIITVVKKAEDDDGIIIRCFETSGRAGECEFQMQAPDLTWRSHFGAHEIKTFVVKNNQVSETDFLEQPATC
ncbi:MAG: glycoside hydrolase family 38 C-terminal domain-containing protein [Limnochordia bacterium]|nr:glycoside hydrolase family 38 C-terminal domain-containing protein [Limnochordia bacterium]